MWSAALKSLVLITLVTLLGACGSAADGPQAGSFTAASTLDINYYWQAFTKNSVWNLKLPPGRKEVPIPSAALDTGPMDPSDADYGIKVYVTKAADPVWNISWDNFNTVADTWDNPNPALIQAPAGMQPPTGGDGIVIVLDKDLHYAYEMYQFFPSGGTTAYASDIEVIDLHSNGIHRNVGITGAGLPGIAGLLKSYETKNKVEIRHKMWVAANPSMLFPGPVWPAQATDITDPGDQAFLTVGDVVALSKNFNLAHNECNLSPFITRIAKALQDYGGIVQDNGGDSLQFVAEVDSIKDYIDVDYDTTMWEQFDCLKQHMVKVQDPWTGAVPGGLGSP